MKLHNIIIVEVLALLVILQDYSLAQGIISLKLIFSSCLCNSAVTVLMHPQPPPYACEGSVDEPATYHCINREGPGFDHEGIIVLYQCLT